MNLIDVSAVFNQFPNALLIDVRSSAEYDEDHLPGAMNLPVLSNEERAAVGEIYHQESQFKARREGAKAICQNVPEIIDHIEQHRQKHQPIVLYCWRGGLRSESLGIILDKIGYPVYRLEGGYKAFRHYVLQFFDAKNWARPVVTIHGLTGSGKTRLLHLLKNQGQSIVDLEQTANHRGSAFGGIGLGAQPSQKTFETQLFQQLRVDSGPVFIEGESRVIGERTIPNPLFDDLVDPPLVWLDTDLQQRIKYIQDEYYIPRYEDVLLQNLSRLKERLGKEVVSQLQKKLQQQQVDEVIQYLLKEYYDPAYRNSGPNRQDTDLVVNGNDLEQARDQLVEYVQNKRLRCGSDTVSPPS